MLTRVQTFLTGLAALLFAALLAFAPHPAQASAPENALSQNPMSGGYQLLEPSALGAFPDKQLNALEKFRHHAKIAPECCNATNKTADTLSDAVDDVKLLPAPSAIGSARRAEPGVASHGGSLPTIKDGDSWLRGTESNAGRVPAQIAEQLSGKEFRNFDHFREEFWRAASNDPVLRKQFDTADQFRMQNGYAPRASGNQQVGGRTKYELDHNQELQHGGNVYDMNNIIIRTPLNHIRGK